MGALAQAVPSATANAAGVGAVAALLLLAALAQVAGHPLLRDRVIRFLERRREQHEWWLLERPARERQAEAERAARRRQVGGRCTG